jgi:hypothetical protein
MKRSLLAAALALATPAGAHETYICGTLQTPAVYVRVDVDPAEGSVVTLSGRDASFADAIRHDYRLVAGTFAIGPAEFEESDPAGIMRYRSGVQIRYAEWRTADGGRSKLTNGNTPIEGYLLHQDAAQFRRNGPSDGELFNCRLTVSDLARQSRAEACAALPTGAHPC